MMRKINNIILAIVFLLSGCSDFLNLEPQDELIREEFWKSERDVVAVLGTTYAKLSGCLDEHVTWSELRGGLLSPNEKKVKQNSLEFFNFNINEYNDKVKWDNFYEVINLTNTILEYAPLAKENDRTFSDLAYEGYIAEATFIRSLCYFSLVKAFRDVPLITQSYSTDDQDFNLAKSTESEIITHLLADLNGILDKAFPVDYFETEEEQKGRANINAVYALLADIYLWNNDYDNCIINADKIKSVFLENGENYFSIFGNDGNSLESIFELQFDYGLYETTNSLFKLFSLNDGGDREYIISEFLVGLFSSNDLREFNEGDEVTFHSTDLYLWKYEGNRPYNYTIDLNFQNTRDKNESDANWIYYRLPEIYLMKAEAYAEKGDLDKAIEQINLVRFRAGLEDYTDVSSQKKVLSEILDERAREFVGEGKRWFDLVRISRRDLDIRLSFISDAVIANVNPRSRTAAATKIKNTDSWFLPIYFNELILNKKLEQNSFYE